ncbi:hypothetical protein SAMN05216276_100972 [Streptosporangium subroseum]|uniref:Uncharacterized protein n=1 Tax=Streptosporangium subroseum TaxID=106412 RepID=A0A239EC99_9ACTN|nr:hypothetical protein [Streptosporangium subroseum]SNS42246.1 hypothetical protein SAMN05216276_100972 [Streptosporangium subroseum]
MQFIRKFLTVTTVAGALAASTLSGVLAASPASAATIECVNGANGFANIAYNKRGSLVNSVDLGGGRKAELHRGQVNGDRGWAIITGSTKAGDKVWMDWTTTAREGGWLQCGPFSVQANGLTNTSAAQKTSTDSRWQFRACGQIVGGSTKCAAWW